MLPRLLAVAVVVAACGDGEGRLNGIDDTSLPPFNPDAVVYADGCDPAPEARACIEANPASFLPSGAAQASEQCRALGYTCCDTDLWMSAAAASCIADQDARLSTLSDNRVTVSCYPDVFGPMYNVYESTPDGLVGLGVHAATGRVTWFDDGDGVFS